MCVILERIKLLNTVILPEDVILRLIQSCMILFIDSIEGMDPFQIIFFAKATVCFPDGTYPNNLCLIYIVFLNTIFDKTIEEFLDCS